MVVYLTEGLKLGWTKRSDVVIQLRNVLIHTLTQSARRLLEHGTDRSTDPVAG